jgi:hypothetical protein
LPDNRAIRRIALRQSFPGRAMPPSRAGVAAGVTPAERHGFKASERTLITFFTPSFAYASAEFMLLLEGQIKRPSGVPRPGRPFHVQLVESPQGALADALS